MNPRLHAYLDECVDPDLGEALRARGFSASHVYDHDMRVLDDFDQFRFAAHNGWVIVTHNLRHFRPFHERCLAQGWHHGGIIGLPHMLPRTYPARLRLLTIRAALLLDHLATLDPPHTQLLPWGVVQRRLEAGHRPAGYTADEIQLALMR